VADLVQFDTRKAFADERFVAYFGGKDEDWGDRAIPYGRNLKAFIEARGGVFERFYEPRDGRHGDFRKSPGMIRETLGLWLKR